MKQYIQLQKDVEGFFTAVTEFYRDYGVGMFGLNKAFHIIMDDEAKQVDIEPITRVEHIELSDLVAMSCRKPS